MAPETADAEFVSLEEADAEAQGKKPAEGEAAEGAEEYVEIEDDEGMDDATFIEEQEEGDEDVTDIIGDVEDEEESCYPSVGRAAPSSWRRRAGFITLMTTSDAELRPPHPAWGHSSVGRALEWHSRGRGFDSPWLHQLIIEVIRCP